METRLLMEFLRAAQVFGGGGDIDDRAEFDRTGGNPDGKVIVAPAARQPVPPDGFKDHRQHLPELRFDEFPARCFRDLFSFR